MTIGYRINLIDLNRGQDEVPEEIDESLLEEGQGYYDHDTGALKMKIDGVVRTMLYEEVHTYSLGDSPTVHTRTWFLQMIDETFDLEGGLYLVTWSYQWSADTTSRDFVSKAWIDGSTSFEHRQEPKDSAGSFGSTGTDQRYVTTFVHPIELSKGAHRFQFSYASGQNNVEASLWNAHLIVRRIRT